MVGCKQKCEQILFTKNEKMSEFLTSSILNTEFLTVKKTQNVIKWVKSKQNWLTKLVSCKRNREQKCEQILFTKNEKTSEFLSSSLPNP